MADGWLLVWSRAMADGFAAIRGESHLIVDEAPRAIEIVELRSGELTTKEEVIGAQRLGRCR
jgi:hypothetical protein